MDEKKAVELRDSERPKNGWDWDTSSCPFFVFGDEDAAENDVKALKKFFPQFKKKSK